MMTRGVESYPNVLIKISYLCILSYSSFELYYYNIMSCNFSTVHNSDLLQ